MPEWAAALHEWAMSIGLQDSVTSIEEIIEGEDSRGTGIASRLCTEDFAPLVCMDQDWLQRAVCNAGNVGLLQFGRIGVLNSQ